MGKGLYGETIISYRPPSTPDYAQVASDGSILRFYADDDIIIISLSTLTEVYKPDFMPAQPPNYNNLKDWFPR